MLFSTLHKEFFMNSSTFTSKPVAWFKTKVFLSFLCALPVIGNAVPFDDNLIRANLNGDYELYGNLDLSGYANWKPIGDEAHPFTGTFNGNGYTITGLTFTGSSAKHVGFFGYIAGAKIENLKVEVVSNSPVNLSSNDIDQSFGVIAGYADGANLSKITVSSPRPLVINRSGYSGAYACNLYVGGLVGYVQGATSTWQQAALIERSASSISLSATNAVSCGFPLAFTGGIAGYSQWFASINNSYSTGAITANGKPAVAGGILGQSYSVYNKVSNSYASGAILANSNYQAIAGGIVGYTTAGAISNSAALNPSVTVKAGGIVTAHRISNDRTSSTLKTYLYYTNNIARDSLSVKRNGLSEDEDKYKNEANGQGGLNRTLAELESQWTYGALGWDFYNIWDWNYTTKRPVLR
jgi:hypothetical protein